MVGGLLQLAVTLWRRKRERDERLRLWLSGAPARARVIGCTDIGGLYGSRRIQLELEVMTSESSVQTTVELSLPVVALPRVQPDAVLEVRHDRDDPSRVALDPLLSGQPF